MNFLNVENPIVQFLSKLTDLILLNIVFIICCIPIITIGASITALYSVTLKSVKNEENYITRTFFKALKDNMKISTLAWLLCVLIAVIFFIDYHIAHSISTPLWDKIQIIFSSLSFLLIIIMLYLFPYIARFKNTLFSSFKNAFLLAISYFPYTILLVLILITSMLFTLFLPIQTTGFTWLVLGFSGLAYINSFIFRKIFSHFE